MPAYEVESLKLSYERFRRKLPQTSSPAIFLLTSPVSVEQAKLWLSLAFQQHAECFPPHRKDALTVQAIKLIAYTNKSNSRARTRVKSSRRRGKMIPPTLEWIFHKFACSAAIWGRTRESVGEKLNFTAFFGPPFKWAHLLSASLWTETRVNFTTTRGTLLKLKLNFCLTNTLAMHAQITIM